jgi:uncharacterized protein
MRLADYCDRVRSALDGVCPVRFALQTNATLLDDAWARLLRDEGFDVGVSLDGPPELHDRFRVDHGGRASSDRVARGVEALRQAGVPLNLLCVLQPGSDGIAIHRHFESLGAVSINYLFPDHTHETVRAVRRRHGPTPCADVLLPILDEWWAHGIVGTRVSVFWEMARVILGGESHHDFFSNPPLRYLFVGADGSIEPLDVLRICGDGFSRTAFDVTHHDFADLLAASPLVRLVAGDGPPLPGGCAGCPEERTCAGGYLPHRFSRTGGFDHPSVWCADLLVLFSRMRELLEVDHDETERRRDLLGELAAVA